MSVSFKAEIRKSQQKRDGTWNVKIRVTKGSDVARIATNYSVDKSQISRKSFEIIDSKILIACNNIIREFRDYILDLGTEVDLYDAKYLAKYLSQKRETRYDGSSLDLLFYCKKHIEKLRKEKRNGYADIFSNTLSWLKKHYKSLPIVNFKTEKIEEIQIEMLKTLSQTSTNIHLRNIRTLFNACVDSLDDVSVIKHYPFRKFTFRPDDKPEEKALDIETLRKIIFFPDHRLKRVNLARDVFYMSYAFLGMNARDFYCSTKYRKGRIEYVREKTKRKGEKAFTAPMVIDEIKPIFEKYRDDSGKRVFNFYKQYSKPQNFVKAINKGLHRLCKETGINEEEVTTYSARHSFATIARNKCNISKDDISICLTHSSGLDITDKYIEIDWSKIDNAQRAVLDYLHEKSEN